MVKYIAIKPCRISGENFYIGDVIPAEKVDAMSISRLASMGYIVESGKSTANDTDNPQNNTQPVENVEIPVFDGDTVNTISVSVSAVTDYFVGVQKSAADVVALLDTETRADLLHLLAAVDTRKTVKAAAEKRLEELAELAGDGE